MSNIGKRWNKHYASAHNASPRYPEAFVNRLLRSKCPVPGLKDQEYRGMKVLDLSCGYGRNIFLLRDLEFHIWATEVTDEMVHKLSSEYPFVNVRKGKAHSLPFESEFFDGVVACNSCYYLDPCVTFADNLSEICRVIKPCGWFLGSLVAAGHTVLQNAQLQADGSYLIADDPMGIRKGYRLQVASSMADVRRMLEPAFSNLKIGYLRDDFEGFRRRLFYFTGYKK